MDNSSLPNRNRLGLGTPQPVGEEEINQIEAALNDETGGTHADHTDRMAQHLKRVLDARKNPSLAEHDDKPVIEQLDARDTAINEQVVTASGIGPDRSALKVAIDKWRKRNHVAHPSDPLATDKAKVRNWLKSRGRTEDDLPAGFWALSRDQRDAALYEISSEVNHKKRLVRQKANEEARQTRQIAKWGLRPDHYSLPPDVQQREYERARKRKQRTTAKSTASTPALESITRDWLATRQRELKTAITSMTPQAARQLDQQQIMKDMVAQHQLQQAGVKVTEGHFSAKVGCTRDAARNRLRRLRRIWPGDKKPSP